tara:strand:+ start:1559 stop:2404 length:846 start_codon:yes stop_codon:yes gene_type:complete
MFDGFTKAPDIRGHEHIVKWFEGTDSVEGLPDNYVIATDTYYANYKTHRKEGSKINQSINEEYIPVVGGLIEASKLGRDEPDVFYKMLAKKTDQYSSAFHGNTHDIGCTMLFVRSDQKQLTKRVFKLKLRVQSEVYDLFHFLGRHKPWSENLTNAKLFLSTSMKLHYEPDRKFKLLKIRQKAQRVSKKRYEHHQAIKNQTPRWADRFKINAIYMERSRRNKRDGKNTWHVDHIFPLTYRSKCGIEGSGLHIHQNLRIVSKQYNLKKSNKFAVDEAEINEKL